MMMKAEVHSFLTFSTSFHPHHGVVCFPPPPPPPPLPPSQRPSLPNRRRRGFKAEMEEIRVCTNRTCRRQGSMQTLELLSDLAPPGLAVKSCGCLGHCGAGPNLALLPQGLIVGHCGTPARAAQLLLGDDGDGETIRRTLDSLALRKRAQGEIEQSNLDEAERLLTQAIDLNPLGGVHVLHRYRSVARLGMGDHSGALEDAREALALAPQYPEAYMCEGDTFMAIGRYDAAEKAYSMCLQTDPSIRRSKSFKHRVAKLQEKLTSANMGHNEQHE